MAEGPRLTHIVHCLDELEAELDALLARDECISALVQLDAREARGETLDVVDPQLLRRHLEQAVACNPHVAAKAQLAGLRQLLANPKAPAAAIPAAVAPPPPGRPAQGVPAQAAAEVVSLDAIKARRDRLRGICGGTVARMAAAALAVAASALLSLGPRQAQDMVAEVSSHAGAHVLGMTCTILSCRIAAAAD